MSLKEDFEAIIQNAQCELRKNNTWISQYKSYSEQLSANAAFIEEKRTKFREWAPLFYYITTSSAKDNKSRLVLDIRYMGQNVANLICDKKDRVIISTKDYNDNNKQHFDCDIELDNKDWDGEEAAKFRKHFRERTPTRNNEKKRNEEHKIESMLLTEFSKQRGEKLLRGIQPVKFARNIRFPMPTALSASKPNDLQFAKKGGGVDILSRVGLGQNTCPCVIEVKDENKTTEPPEVALKQAINYAVFIRELLRSPAGPLWWRLVGFQGNIPDILTLYAACAMPTLEPARKDYKEFGGMPLNIGNDIIECHYIYFSLSPEKSSLQSLKTSLPQIS
jgi:hypothetical protein